MTADGAGHRWESRAGSKTPALDVLVVGGGQAGLAAGYHLKRRGLRFAILDAHERVGDAWRRRWTSLELFTTAHYSALPGLVFPGNQERFPGKDEVADYMDAYVRHHDLPVVLGARVEGLEANAAGAFVARAGEREFTAPNVIVATGAYRRPVIPAVSTRLDERVVQVHSADYVDPTGLPPGDVLVVGSANSGVQIAQEIAASRRVHLARGTRLRRTPRRILGRSLHWWAERLRLIDAPLHTLRGRLVNRNDLLIGTSLRQLERRHGVVLHGRAVDAAGSTVRFDDGSSAMVEAVVWATGFRDDFSWLKVPVLDERGRPVHRRGETQVPGLFFVGLHRQWSRGSSLIGWVEQDANFVAGRIAARATGAGGS